MNLFWLVLACRTFAVDVPVDTSAPGGGDTSVEPDPEPFEPEPLQEPEALFWGDWDCGPPAWVVAQAGPSQWVAAGDEVLVDAGLLEGERASWALLRGEAELEVLEGQVRFTPASDGLYELRLIVDGAQDQDKDRVLVQVGGEVAPPSAVVADAFDLYIGDSVTLDSSASRGPEGVALRTVWTLLEQPVGSEIEVLGQDGARLDFTPDLPGLYTFRSEVSAGAVTDKATVRVSVAGPVWAPGYLPLETVTLSATGLEGWTPDVLVKWAGTDGALPVEQLPEAFGSCVSLIPQAAAQLEFKVVFSDPESGEVLARHYPKYSVLDGPWPQAVQLLETPSAVQVRSMGGQLVIRSGVESALLVGSPELGFEAFAADWGWGARVFEVANLASGAVVVADRGPLQVFSEPVVHLGEGRDAAFVLDDPVGDWLLVDGVLYDSALQAQGELRRDGGRVRLDEAVSVDLDGDGELELVVIERIGAEQVLRRFSSRPSEVVEVADTPSVPVLFKFGMTAGELDGDGYPELLLSDGAGLHRVSGGAEVLLEALPWVDGGGEELSSPQLEDLDGDGALDLVVQGEGITVNQARSGSTWVLHGPITAPVSLLGSSATLYAGAPDQRMGEPHWTGTQLIGASWDGLWVAE